MDSPLQQAVVTGVGAITGEAGDARALWRCRAAPAPAGAVLPIDPVRPLDPVLLRPPGRVGDLVARAAVHAAEDAWSDAGLADPGAPGGPHPERVGVCWGVGLAGLRAAERAAAAAVGGRAPHPRDALGLSPAEPVAALARRFGALGPCRGVATACASGTDALLEAVRLVAAGECDVVVAGAAEAGATEANLAGLRRLGVLSPAGSARPFDAGRDGLVLAEGAAALIVESLAHAVARGAAVMARVLGGAACRDAAGVVRPHPGGEGVARCMRTALRRAGIGPGDVAVVDAHATGTVHGDAAEARGLAAVFGDARSTGPGDGVRVPAVTAGKGATGHAMAAAGALDAVTCVLMLSNDAVPPVPGLLQPALEAAPLDLVCAARTLAPGAVASVSVGFGGFVSVALFAADDLSP